MRILRRNDAQFAALVSRYRGKLLGLASLFFSDASKREDAVQETFLKFMGRMDLINEVESPCTECLCQIVLFNTCRDMLRSEKRCGEVELTEEALQHIDEGKEFFETEPRFQDDYFSGNEALRQAVSLLKPEVQEMLWLKYEYGMNAGEIGRLCGKQPTTVQKAMKRAQQKLKELLEGGHHEE